MAYTTADFLPRPHHGWKGLRASISEWVQLTRGAVLAAERVRVLSEKSDAELDALGIKRSDIAQEGLKLLNAKA